MSDINKRLQTLVYKAGGKLGPSTHKHCFVELFCHCDFEPHGRASETWEYVWALHFPQIPRMWKSTKGWIKCVTHPYGMQFQGRTPEDVLTKAEKFFEEIGEQNDRPKK